MAKVNGDWINDLIAKANEAKRFAYCRYSNFHVGAALLLDDGEVILGCNVENASYGATICAERVAITKAISQGLNKFKAVAVIG